MQEALDRAGIDASQVDYVNAHGTATPLNDAMESKALARVLGTEKDRVWVSSSKGQIGHTLAAAGAIEAVISALAVRDRSLPPTAGLVDPDPACALRHVTQATKVERTRAVISNSFGFGGMDGAIVVTEPELARERHVTRSRVFVRASCVIGPRGVGDGEGLATGEVASGAAPHHACALDVARARRFDRAARLCAATAHGAIQNARVADESDWRTCAGVVFGSAFSSVDEAAAFVQRIFDKGPRLASPADFPNLVPSSPIGHASIYESLRGPALATADLRASGESALATAIELLAAGDADCFIAGATAVRSELIDHVFHPLFDDGATHAPRAECSAAAWLTRSEENAVAAITDVKIARSGTTLALTTPSDVLRARVFGAVSPPAIATWIRQSAWENVAIESVERGVGSNEAGGAAAFAAATSAIARGAIDDALVVGARPNVVYAFVLRRV